jgi:hypothetical protein
MDTDTTTNTDCVAIVEGTGTALLASRGEARAIALPVVLWTNQTNGNSQPFVVEIERTPEGYRRLVTKNVPSIFGVGASASAPVEAVVGGPPGAKPPDAVQPEKHSGRRHTLYFLLGWLISVILLLAFFSLVRWLAL